MSDRPDTSREAVAGVLERLAAIKPRLVPPDPHGVDEDCPDCEHDRLIEEARALAAALRQPEAGQRGHCRDCDSGLRCGPDDADITCPGLRQADRDLLCDKHRYGKSPVEAGTTCVVCCALAGQPDTAHPYECVPKDHHDDLMRAHSKWEEEINVRIASLCDAKEADVRRYKAAEADTARLREEPPARRSGRGARESNPMRRMRQEVRNRESCAPQGVGGAYSWFRLLQKGRYLWRLLAGVLALDR